jgi:hypothetical protein
MFLVRRLPGDAKDVGDGLPRPAAGPGVLHVQGFKLIDQRPQRRHRRQTDRRITAVDRFSQSDGVNLN